MAYSDADSDSGYNFDSDGRVIQDQTSFRDRGHNDSDPRRMFLRWNPSTPEAVEEAEEYFGPPYPIWIDPRTDDEKNRDRERSGFGRMDDVD